MSASPTPYAPKGMGVPGQRLPSRVPAATSGSEGEGHSRVRLGERPLPGRLPMSGPGALSIVLFIGSAGCARGSLCCTLLLHSKER